MEIQYLKDSRTILVKIDCELDHHSSNSIRRRVDGDIQRYAPKNIVFDFEGVRFMDSSGIGLIMGRYKNIARFDGRAGMINVRPEVKRLFEMSGLSKLIPHYDSLDKAIN